ncbi:outer membrane protein OmpK [Aeromonas australiensis]|uniref:nucleoside-specific channel-forming Tsx family protein n=1 Tax=Aeromonas australiensis TaxID=1114880 RepID=UPI000589D3C5|nr:outer membrane protein OmpK [Aeromonas australiensis]
MAKFTKTLIAAGLMAAAATPAFAADYSGDIHKNDYKWFQFNIMHGENNKLPFSNNADNNYFEMEFGGRSGIFDLYGYIDVLDVFNEGKDNFHNKDNFFMKFAPRMSIDGLTGKDLSFGPVKEVYVASVTNIADQGLFETYIGLGSDVEVPFMGKMGLNLMSRYVRENYGASNEGKWDGYMLTTNWFKPVYNFSNGSFIAYQGYLDYMFGADELEKTDASRTSESLQWFNGLYWHSDRFALGYGLKVYNNMAFFKDGAQNFTGATNNTSGVGHYFAATYKF